MLCCEIGLHYMLYDLFQPGLQERGGAHVTILFLLFDDDDWYNGVVQKWVVTMTCVDPGNRGRPCDLRHLQP